jgi:hypothetical protein
MSQIHVWKIRQLAHVHFLKLQPIVRSYLCASPSCCSNSLTFRNFSKSLTSAIHAHLGVHIFYVLRLPIVIVTYTGYRLCDKFRTVPALEIMQYTNKTEEDHLGFLSAPAAKKMRAMKKFNDCTIFAANGQVQCLSTYLAGVSKVFRCIYTISSVY